MPSTSRLGLVLTLLALSVVGAPPAKADGSCTAGKYCLWLDSNFSGCKYEFDRFEPDLRNSYFTDCPQQSVNDQVSSFDNTTGRFLLMWSEPNYKGKLLCVTQHQRANVPLDMNDKISSIRAYAFRQPGCN